MASGNPSRSNQRFGRRTISAKPGCHSACLSPLSSVLSLRSSNFRSISGSSSASSRPMTGEHMLDWYIPRHIAATLSSAGNRSAAGNENDTDSHGGSAKKPTADETDSCDKDNVTVPSPLHNDSKQEWTTRYTDERIRSLPLPPPHKPKILKFPAHHANNLSDVFGKALAEPNNYLFYSRYGVPMVPLAAIVPPNYYPLPMQNNRTWDHQLMQDSTNPSYQNERILPPPPQAMFLHAGGPQRRHFSVAPDWRRIRHDNYYY